MGLSGSSVYSVTTSRGAFVVRVQVGDRDAWVRISGIPLPAGPEFTPARAEALWLSQGPSRLSRLGGLAGSSSR